MCGIVGFLGSGNQDIITHMAESTHYRGPDFTGAFYDDSHQIGLGHNRLSIIDLSAPSNQPFFLQTNAMQLYSMEKFITTKP